MKINGCIYERTFNLGDYNSEKIGLTADIKNNEEAAEAIAQLKELVLAAHEGTTPTPLDEEKTNKKAKKASKKKGKKNAKSNHTDDEDSDDESDDEGDDDSSDESDSDDEAADEEDSDDSDSDSDDDEESEEDDEPKAKSKKAKSGKGGKSDKKAKGSKKGKPQTYDRNNENHKEIFSEVLTSVDPHWEVSDRAMKAAKNASLKMAGVEFLDADGEVLPDFTKEVKKLMKKKKK